MKRRTPAEKMDGKYIPEPNSGCWLWLGTTNPQGYGVVGVCVDGKATTTSAQRVSYEAFVGPIPEGLYIDHLCRLPSCVNPSHMEPVTARENSLRGIGIAAQHARKTACVNGHEFNEENTLNFTGKGGPRRICRACNRQRARMSSAQGLCTSA